MPIGKRVDPPKKEQNGKNREAPAKTVPKEMRWVLSKPKYQLKDLILADETREQLRDVISYFENRTLLFQTWGLEERYAERDGLAVNLYGAPGTGKTMAAHAIASALRLPLICVDYAEIESKYVGETSKNLSALFREATERKAIIFFDEADALLSKRVTNMTSATDVSVNQTRSVLLTLLNEYRGVILFATNFIQNFDAAFLRRIQYHVFFSLPDEAQRKLLWEMYIPKKMPCAVDFAALAKTYPGVSGSDISNAVFSAAVGAAREGESMVRHERFELAIRRILAVKQENEGKKVVVTRRIVSEAEVPENLRSLEEK